MAMGMDMLLESVFRLAKVNPEQLKTRAVELEQAVLEIQALLRAIYRQNALIMQAQGVQDNGQPVSDRSLRIATGSGLDGPERADRSDHDGRSEPDAAQPGG